MRITIISTALLAATVVACSNDSKLQDTAMHGPAGATGGDTSRATANTSGTGVQTGSQVAPTSGAPTSPTTATIVGGTSKTTTTDTAAKKGAKKP